MMILFLKTFLCLITCLLAFNASAQQDDVITIAEFEAIKFNDHTIKQLMEIKDYEVFLEQLYGTPIDKKCTTHPQLPYGCNLYYNGFEFHFGYEDVLIDITINGGNNSFFYKNKALKPGMSIDDLKHLFPNSYNTRYKIQRTNNTEETFMRVMIGHLQSPSVLLFKLNISMNLVSEVSIGTGGEQ